ncbi:MAG: glycosyltransferase [Nitrospirota bacterium]
MVRTAALKLGVEIARRSSPPEGAADTVVSLRPEVPGDGTVLLSYILSPFLLKEHEPLPTSHNNYRRSLQIAKVFLSLGYAVDVIDYRNAAFIPRKPYSCIVDVRRNLERLDPFLNEDCIRIMHIDTCHALFHNAAETRRLMALQYRRGVALQPRRTAPLNRAIEHADYATMTGNAFTIGTFAYARKPIFRVPQTACAVYPWPEEKDYGAYRKSFLWLGSGGLVHKGLDLVLEAFAGMPEYRLSICGPVEREQDFVAAYRKELYHTPNIHTIGWVDVASPAFIDITRRCIGMVYPSCSEAQAGSVVACMHAGVIPVVSCEAGVDAGDFGLTLVNSSVDEIQQAVRWLSQLSPGELREKARKTWDHARAYHTHERFEDEYRTVIETIMIDRGRACCASSMRRDGRLAPAAGSLSP